MSAAINNTEIKLMTVSTACTTGRPYIFKAMDGGTEVEVSLSMPLGGVESGLYRSPKSGEKVLVAVVTELTFGINKDGDIGITPGTATRYLVGYLPNATDQNFSRKVTVNNVESEDASVINDLGEVFRYRQTGKKPDKTDEEEYSEIGFYNRQTLWDAPDTDRDNYADNKNGDEYIPPKIDRINIHSTGDIYESAVNHHQVKARRLELLADDDLTKTVDPADFKHGDIHVKAAKDITIEAGDTITIKAGRTSLVISDDKFEVTNQLMSALPNPVDAKISLNARNGVSIAGQAVNISSDRKWSVGDKFGASISGVVGVVNVTGREIDLSTVQWLAQLGSNIAYGIDYVSKVTAGGIALNSYSDDTKKNSQYTANWILTSTKLLFSWLFLIFKYYGVPWALPDDNYSKKGRLDAYNKKVAGQQAAGQQAAGQQVAFTLSPSEMILKAANTEPYMMWALGLDMILELVEGIYAVLEWSCGFEGEKLDQFNFSTLVINQGLTLTATSVMLKLNPLGYGNAELNLGYDGEAALKAAKEKEFYAEAKTTGAATTTMLPKWGRLMGLATGAISELTKDIEFINSVIENSPKKEKSEEML